MRAYQYSKESRSNSPPLDAGLTKQNNKVWLSEGGGWERQKALCPTAVGQPVPAPEAHSKRQPHFVTLLQRL